MSELFTLQNYPLPSSSSLAAQFVGKTLNELPTPAVVLDRALIKRNCNAMLNVCKELGVGFRAHVKSHKTAELSKLQVGEEGAANFIVSTIIEAEKLAELVVKEQGKGRDASILYGVPVPQSGIPRLIALAEKLKPRSINLIIDNQDAFLKLAQRLAVSSSQVELGIFIKIDTGYERAGIKTSSPSFPTLVSTVVSKTQETGSKCFLQGFYSHFGHSYAGSSEDDAANGLMEELVGLEAATKAVPASFAGKLVLSVGATPTATAAQNMLSSASPRVREFQTVLSRLQAQHLVELHAGVYPLLDCQQVATHARPPTSSSAEPRPAFQPLSKSNIGIRMLLEVTSVYNERAKPEALVSAGSLAMGREPCKSYAGWGIVTPDLGNSSAQHIYDEQAGRTGWVVGRISQEHGILTWEGDKAACNELVIGDKVMIWPNHACVAGAGFGWYLVVDSEEGRGETVVDVWVRWRGW
ncbi:hypothetical protein COCMIDRAFT_8377 [Bipolaris oryzae ATCC 44560]|uniref:D-serine dehydratase n=1 Tax=Bipolaris oryzae ATCC 44560 TaxID=930090 RepID=W6ZEL8_COCMI|nr:uncharacterized protein COCMIDRAFT_8377 [Bipolaris oryzae ATCC 44560]EUC41971.1 hypothetical protein COCMIDRAFT_8377 [Bipolaris oryzae ATCC 44560]